MFDVESLIECEDIWGAKTSRMLGRFGLGAPTVRAWTVTIREEAKCEGLLEILIALIGAVRNLLVLLGGINILLI